MGRQPAVYLNHSGWFGIRTVTLYEFGHAFELLDTYVGTGGACQQGQPASVVCTAGFDQLQYDDLNGIQTMYQQIKAGKIKQAPEDFARIVF